MFQPVNASVPGAASPAAVDNPNALAPAAAAPRPRLDDTADALPDGLATFADRISQRAALLLLAQKQLEEEQEARLAKMRSDFNAAQEDRSELLREANTLRDMAMEQMKKDDEILKKWIAMI
ncbi:MAG: hypothetical protein ACLPYS_03315 [Vulcanimicrobiaceae bacterium]